MMRLALFLCLFSITLACNTSQNKLKNQPYNQESILKELDLAFQNNESSYFPQKLKNNIHYNFFLDLENGYTKLAGSKIHLYGDSIHWAIVFETNGYHSRQGIALIELVYVGNNINYIEEVFPERSYISNQKDIVVIDVEEFERIKQSDDFEGFELINKYVNSIKLRNSIFTFINDPKFLMKLNIPNRKNKENLIDFASLVRMLNVTHKDLMCANEDEISKQFIRPIPKIMELENFHFISNYENAVPPSEQELFQLIAQILETRDVSLWTPTEQPNNHWTNWASGNL